MNCPNPVSSDEPLRGSAPFRHPEAPISNEGDGLTSVHVSFRLSARQVSLIRPGVSRLASAQELYNSTKKLPNASYPFRIYPLKNPKRKGTHHKYMMKQIEEAWPALQSRSRHGVRLNLTTFQIRAYILALRIEQDCCRADSRFLKKRNNLRNVPPDKKKAEFKRRWTEARSLEQLKRDSERVIHALDKHMKRANCRMKSALGIDSFKLLVAVWQQHVQWLRMNLVYFRRYPRTPLAWRKQKHILIDEMVERATEGISREGCVPPSKKRLRSLMRLWLRYRRAGSVWCSLDFRTAHPSVTRSVLARFVTSRVKCRERHK